MAIVFTDVSSIATSSNSISSSDSSFAGREIRARLTGRTSSNSGSVSEGEEESDEREDSSSEPAIFVMSLRVSDADRRGRICESKALANVFFGIPFDFVAEFFGGGDDDDCGDGDSIRLRGRKGGMIDVYYW